MEESPSRNNVRRVTPMEKKPPKPKTPPPPKPKPSRLSTNKVNNDPNSSPPKRTNTNGIRGANVHRLSSVFEDKNGPVPKFKPLLAPSLPLSAKLPVPTVAVNPKRPKVEKKSVRSSTTTSTTTTTTKVLTETEVDESPLNFGDVKATFEQAEVSDVVV